MAIYEFEDINTEDLDKAIECIEILDAIFGEHTINEELEQSLRAELRNREAEI